MAAVYYVASRILGNPKYRWMALLTTALTVLWVFAVDLVALSPSLRVVSFLALGTALIVISMAYSRRDRDARAQAQARAQARPGDSSGPQR